MSHLLRRRIYLNLQRQKHLSLLNRLSSMPASRKSLFPCIFRHLRRLATMSHESSGLARMLSGGARHSAWLPAVPEQAGAGGDIHDVASAAESTLVDDGVAAVRAPRARVFPRPGIIDVGRFHVAGRRLVAEAIRPGEIGVEWVPGTDLRRRAAERAIDDPLTSLRSRLSFKVTFIERGEVSAGAGAPNQRGFACTLALDAFAFIVCAPVR